MDTYDKKVIIATNSYKEKYYFSDEFKSIPQQVKNELITISVKIVESCGGIFVIGFYGDGTIYLEITAEESDLNYDEIGAKLEVNYLEKDREELWDSLKLWYNACYIK